MAASQLGPIRWLASKALVSQEEPDPTQGWAGNHPGSAPCTLAHPLAAVGYTPRAPWGRQTQAAWALHRRPAQGHVPGEAWALTPPRPPLPARLPARGPGHGYRPCQGIPGPTLLARPDLHMLISCTSLAPLASLFGERLDLAIPVLC